MAADALIRSEVDLKGDIIVALPMGEEVGGVGITHLLKSGVTADMGVITESTNLGIATTGAGIAKFQVSTIGKSMHVGNMENGIDAISKMCKVVSALKKFEFTHKPDPRVPKLPRVIAGTIIGGRGRNHDLQGPQNLADYCTLLINVRFWKSQTVESIERDLRRSFDQIAKEDPEFKYELNQGYEPFTSSITRPTKDVPLDSPIIGIVKNNHEYVTGATPKFRKTEETVGNDDGAQMNAWGIPTITYGPGPGEKDLDKYSKINLVEKWIDIDTMNICTKVLALSTFDVCNIDKV
jgi:acetylornithine deacetylase/succinyl-diaminopimelate desuccinylase-like protein